MGKPVKITDQNKVWSRMRRERRVRVLHVRKRFLIVSEGKKTEPFYFKAFEKGLPRGTLQVETRGVGRSTQSLVDVIRQIRDELQAEYAVNFNEVWAVFDKDDFKNDSFDNAIHSRSGKQYEVAWSNECFELWYLLHFKDQTTHINRKAVFKALERELGVHNYEGLKGDAGRGFHEKMAIHSNQATAIERAKKLFENWSDPQAKRTPPSQQNPCTTVFLLVEKLLACRQPEQ